MRRFVFRLETVLQHRAALETLREQDFARAQGHLQTLQMRLTALETERARVIAERPGKRGELFDAHRIFDRERYVETLHAAIAQQTRRVETAQVMAEEARHALLLARQAREAVDQLKTKDQALHIALAQKAEQETLDELATLRHARAELQDAA